MMARDTVEQLSVFKCSSMW